MSEENKTPSWWHTVPGMLTGIAALVTAVTGVVALLYQNGLWPRARRTSNITSLYKYDDTSLRARSPAARPREQESMAGLVLLTLMLPFLMGQGYPQETPLLGGAGGSLIRVTCPAGTFLSGVSARVGAFVGEIQTWCAAARPDGLWAGQPFRGPLPGMGSSGAPDWQSKTCPRNSYIRDFNVTVYMDGVINSHGEGDPRHTYVAVVGFGCYSPENKIYSGIEILGPHAEPFRYKDFGLFECLGLATGLRGQSGLYVDSVGLTCAPFTPLPRSDCMSCHQSGRWSGLRAGVVGWTLASLVPVFALALAAFVRSGLGRGASGQIPKLTQRSLFAIVVACGAAAFFAQRWLMESIHFPWSSIAAGFAVVAVGLVGLGAAVLLRVALARRKLLSSGM